ncbi:MAG: TIGR02281 family clan AA aspartic protease [Rickettsiales bacterium]
MFEENGPNWANIVYYAAFMVFIGGGLLSRYRGKGGKALAHFSGWMAVFFVLTLLYAYRHPLKDVKDAWKSAIFPSSPIQKETGEIVVQRASDGHFYVDGELNGASVTFLVDTGAGAVVISPHTAQKAGYDMKNLRFSMPFDTANGRIFAAPVDGKLKIANAEFSDVTIFVSSGAGDANVLGMSFLNKFSRYAVERDALTLYP